MAAVAKPKVNSINLLEAFDPEKLARLRSRHVPFRKYFDADMQGVADAPTAVQSELAVATLDAAVIAAVTCWRWSAYVTPTGSSLAPPSRQRLEPL
jgi:hypothetical protein